VSIVEKYHDIVDKLHKVDNDIILRKMKYPKYVSNCKTVSGGFIKKAFVYETRENGNRTSVKYTLKSGKTLGENYEIFRDIVKEKKNILLDSLENYQTLDELNQIISYDT